MARKTQDQPTGTEQEEAQESQEIIQADPQSLRPHQRYILDMLTTLESMGTDETPDDRGFGEDIAAILMAETEEQMWDADELPRINAKVLSGTELEILGFDVKFSDDPEITTGLIGPGNGRKMYLLVQSVRLNRSGNEQVYRLPKVGEVFVWNTSARFIVAKLFWFWQHGYFNNNGSAKARIQGTDLGGGKSVEKLKSLAAPMVGGQTEQPTDAPF